LFVIPAPDMTLAVDKLIVRALELNAVSLKYEII
jgi:hypothetical protein